MPTYSISIQAILNSGITAQSSTNSPAGSRYPQCKGTFRAGLRTSGAQCRASHSPGSYGNCSHSEPVTCGTAGKTLQPEIVDGGIKAHFKPNSPRGRQASPHSTHHIVHSGCWLQQQEIRLLPQCGAQHHHISHTVLRPTLGTFIPLPWGKSQQPQWGNSDLCRINSQYKFMLPMLADWAGKGGRIWHISY